MIITALGIDAADTVNGSRATLLGQLIGAGEICPSGMAEVPGAVTFTCVDIYEASPATTCPEQQPASQSATVVNTQSSDCVAESKAEVLPWRFITRDQAQTMCLKSGKRLPSNLEWQMISLGTPDNDSVCNSASDQLHSTGSYTSCKSAIGVMDTVGNLWEWTSDEVVQGVYNNRTVPASGYVTSADAGGAAVETASQPNDLYGADYFWSNNTIVSAVMRGGFYGSGSDAGVYAFHADVAADMQGAAIGFRCVQ